MPSLLYHLNNVALHDSKGYVSFTQHGRVHRFTRRGAVLYHARRVLQVLENERP